MLRRPQRTKDRLRAGGEDGAYLCGSLEGGGEQTSGPARSRRKPLRLKREHGAYRRCCFRSRSTARALRSGTGRAAQQCTRRARGAGGAEQELSALAERVRASPAAAV